LFAQRFFCFFSSKEKKEEKEFDESRIQANGLTKTRIERCRPFDSARFGCAQHKQGPDFSSMVELPFASACFGCAQHKQGPEFAQGPEFTAMN
jgi:hypothetical protein